MGSNIVKDLTGQTYGRLLVQVRETDYFSPKGKRHVRWQCRCSCGVIVVVTSNQLRTGQTRSCGCLRREVTSARVLQDLTGLRFGRWIVLGRHGTRVTPNGSKQPLWDALCDCGTRGVVTGVNLRTGQTKSCGCTQRVEVPRYGSLHQRVRVARGSADVHACVVCGEPAHEWSYIEQCPDELLDGNLRYCLHPEHYEPNCTECHGVFTRAYSRVVLGKA